MAPKDVIVEEEEEDLGMAMQKLPIPFKELEQIPLYGFANRVKDIIDSSSILLEDSDPSHVSSDISPPRNKRGRRKNSEAKEEVDDLTDKSCSHCGTRHTPLWREGPRGAGTLCNACGMRYRTGRLLPEYRPASSPGFKPDVHSNFHRKVLEIRRERNPPPPPR